MELRPEVQQEKCPRRAGHVGKRGEQPLALRIDPVGVVEIDHERSGGAAGAEQASEQACDRTLLLDGISRGLARRSLGHVEEVVREWQRVDERGVKRDEEFRNLRACQLRILVLIDAEGAQQQVA